MSVYQFCINMADGSTHSLEEYAGQVLLIVNTASKCGFTPQYKGLEALYRRYAEQGFAVLAFPCNQFADQEPGDAEEIATFCSLNYDVTFPLAAKVDVNGEQADPLWTYMKAQQSGLLGSRSIKWNFTKFLVNRKGQVVRRYGSAIKPEQLDRDIEQLLNEQR